MLVRVKEQEVPFVGKRGETKEIDSDAARTLILLGKVEEVVAPAAQEPAAEPPSRRGYRRRDISKPTTLSDPKAEDASRQNRL